MCVCMVVLFIGVCALVLQEGLPPQSDWMRAIEDDDAGHLAQRRDQASYFPFDDSPEADRSFVPSVCVCLCVSGLSLSFIHRLFCL
eukprot:m.419780 g.419780  ORF g.419780 m.419780 type:complete len:86 (-) comp56629_c0_seq1:664-921(-)